MVANKRMMPTELLKMLYIQSWVSGDALTQFEPRLHENNTCLFTTAIKILDTLTTVFGDPNRKQTARTKY